MTTNYKPIPISQPPEKEGWYVMTATDGHILPRKSYFSKIRNNWDDMPGAFYLLPVPDSIILTQSELEIMLGKAYKAGKNYGIGEMKEWGGGPEHKFPDQETTINNLLNKK